MLGDGKIVQWSRYAPWNVPTLFRPLPNRLSLPDARTCLLHRAPAWHARRFIEALPRVEVVYPSELFGPFVASNAPANTLQPDDEE